ncbi:copper resistance protein CopC [Streptomyces sp. P17]|uniref:copper resistance CopC family protein n=1 Tax=Streptomyces sp. P17 TaxID=3074716 RepID=UPI0028F43683|nr:copper resistance protein CopC [Streptomyces sp. P17]MDT9698377.1 copper resistance protein CopC [Streptomyces sp. P17]
MHVTDRRAARTAARVLVVPAALTALAVTAPQAAAHTELESTKPRTDASLAGLPPRVTLTFSDPMTQKYAKVAVTGADGASAAKGEPQVEGKTVTLPLDTGAPAGRYTVGYRVVSADGHPVAGSYTFTVKQTAQTPSPSATVQQETAASPTSVPSPEADQADEESSSVAVPVLAGAGALAAAAAGAVGAYVVRRRRTDHGD